MREYMMFHLSKFILEGSLALLGISLTLVFIVVFTLFDNLKERRKTKARAKLQSKKKDD